MGHYTITRYEDARAKLESYIEDYNISSKQLYLYLVNYMSGADIEEFVEFLERELGLDDDEDDDDEEEDE